MMHDVTNTGTGRMHLGRRTFTVAVTLERTPQWLWRRCSCGAVEITRVCCVLFFCFPPPGTAAAHYCILQSSAHSDTHTNTGSGVVCGVISCALCNSVLISVFVYSLVFSVSLRIPRLPSPVLFCRLPVPINTLRSYHTALRVSLSCDTHRAVRPEIRLRLSQRFVADVVLADTVISDVSIIPFCTY